eukprot:GHVP01053844.1.p1 GENE.GHVP01053844.1~~GHVP01053844.1.p1  ORF type:complete len:126 (+),score=19.41 GHVP01053844.1:165-542(+)
MFIESVCERSDEKSEKKFKEFFENYTDMVEYFVKGRIQKEPEMYDACLSMLRNCCATFSPAYFNRLADDEIFEYVKTSYENFGKLWESFDVRMKLFLLIDDDYKRVTRGGSLFSEKYLILIKSFL